ncbi:HAT family dimerization domain-containing protein [Favolaschia claudopus]|uniref:HAT family dimerization domain-containing protein n=1 Tax=Favolaschia claudopus TaxID=2862362 RepID=A0AAW0BIK4_9AGAR
MASTDQCAIGADGQLLDASKITFYNDPDDPNPLPAVKLNSTATGGQATQITQFFRKASSRLTDPNNAELKCKASEEDTSRPRARARTRHASTSPEPMDEDKEDSDDEMPGLEDPSDSEGEEDEDDNPTDTDEISDDVNEAYERTKALGDADRAAMRPRPKAELTKDIEPIYEESELKDSDTGVVTKGYWCRLCKKDKVATKKCFFTGNVSARRTHISRNSNHFEVYKQLCEENKLPLHPRATPRGYGQQSTLEGFATKTPPFTSEGLVDHLVELMVTEDDAFRLVDKAPFRRVLHYCRPSLKESDIPHRTKMRGEILTRASEAEDRLREKLSKIPGQVSFTFDTWTSKTGDPFFGVTGHYIDSPPDSPEDWSLKSEQLAYTPIEGNHSGQNLSKILVRAVDRYDLREKMGWGTADNATNNDTCMKCAGEEVDPLKLRWDPVERRVRCMEHAVHLAAKHFIDHVSPISAKAVVAKAKKLRKELKAANPDLDDDEIDTLLAAEDDGPEDDGGENDGNEDEPRPKDALGKALALIRASPQAQAFFKKMCVEADVPALQLLGWIRTRWALMFTFLDRLILLRLAVNRFVLLADDSSEVPNLVKKSYANFRLSNQDWEHLGRIREVLQEPANIQQSFSSSRYPTVWRTLPLLEALAETWRNMAATDRFADMQDSIYAGLENIENWYGKTNDTDVYFICLALDPNIKTAYTQESWNSEAYEEGLAKLESVVLRCLLHRSHNGNPGRC